MDITTRTPWPAKGTTVVTDAGLETWLVFQRGIELPAFAAYPLAATATDAPLLSEYLQHYVAIAASIGAAVVLDAADVAGQPRLGHGARP